MEIGSYIFNNAEVLDFSGSFEVFLTASLSFDSGGLSTMDIEPIEIRPAMLEDASDISSLSLQLGYKSSDVEVKKRLGNIIYSNDHCLFVACQINGRIIGWIHVFSTLRVESDSFCEIGGLIVDKLYRNQGVGAKLIYVAQEWAAQQGCTVLRVRSRKERESAGKFYLKEGFSLVKEQRIFNKKITTNK